MLSSQMIKSCNVITEEGKQIFLRYFITRKFYLHKTQKIMYGIAIEQTMQNKPTEIETIENITYDLNIAYETIKLMSENMVTPVTMLDVLDDLCIVEDIKTTNIA